MSQSWADEFFASRSLGERSSTSHLEPFISERDYRPALRRVMQYKHVYAFMTLYWSSTESGGEVLIGFKRFANVSAGFWPLREQHELTKASEIFEIAEPYWSGIQMMCEMGLTEGEIFRQFYLLMRPGRMMEWQS